MDNDNLHKELKTIGKYMVSQIKREMSIKGIKASKSLYNSLDSKVNDNTLTIESLDYGSVILGEGAGPDAKTPSKEMVSNIMRWMSYKGISPLSRGRGGRFRKQSYNTKKMSAFAIARGIRRRGIKGSMIIQDTVRKLEGRIEKGVVEAYKADVMKEFDEILIRINKQQ